MSVSTQVSCLYRRRSAPEPVKYPRLLQSHLTRHLMSAVPVPTGDKSQMLVDVFGQCERGIPPPPQVFSMFSKTYQTSFFNIKYLLSLPWIVFDTISFHFWCTPQDFFADVEWDTPILMRFTSVIRQTSGKNECTVHALYFSSYFFTGQMHISVYLNNVSFVYVTINITKCTCKISNACRQHRHQTQSSPFKLRYSWRTADVYPVLFLP